MSAAESERKWSLRRKVGTVVVVSIAVAIPSIVGWCALFAPLFRSKISTQGRAVSEVRSLAVGLRGYWMQFGSYPPDTIAEASCSPELQMSEALAQYLATALVSGRGTYGPYVAFPEARLTDADGDGFLELRDPWGGPFMYGQKDWRGRTPTVNDEPFDMVSAGPDGVLGGAMVPGTGYVPAAAPEGTAYEQDNITLDTEAVPGREFD